MKKILLLLTIMLLVGCKGAGTETVYLEPALRKAVYAYYDSEKKGDWAKTYEYRDKTFKKVVPKAFYVTQMEKDNKGWRLLSFDIVSSIKEDENLVILKIKFKEKTPRTYTLDRKHINTFEIAHETKWINIDGEWYCKDAGSRTHLSLNHEME